MGVTTTPINGFTLPDDNELLRNVYSHLRNHAAQLEAALRTRGLTSADVLGYLDLLGRVNTMDTDTGWSNLTISSGMSTTALGARYRRLNRWGIIQAELQWGAITANTVLAKVPVTDTTTRPVRAWWFAAPIYGGAPAPFYVDAAGQLVSANALGAGGGFLMVHFPLG